MIPDFVNAAHRSKTEPPPERIDRADGRTVVRRWTRWLGILPSNRRRREMAEIVDILCPECCETDLEVEVVPEEPMVVRYADGSGYPGAPATAEVIGQSCACEVDPIRVLEEAEEALADREAAEEDYTADLAWEERRERWT